MKFHLLLILFASAVLALNLNSQQSQTPLDEICGRVADRKCISRGVLNGMVASVELPAYPQKAQEKQIEGTITVQLIFNEDGEVISASPASGPEELWAAAVKASATTRFHPTKLSGKSIKVRGLLNVSFKNGKIDIPKPSGTAPVSTPSRP